MKFYLRDLNKDMVEKWKEFFGDNPDFDIAQGDIFSVPKADALVSPANSFGFMDGGIDWAYTKKFGVKLEFRLRNLIADKYHGELPVGQAVLVPTENEDYPFLVSAPTMRVPGVVRNTVNAYLAFRAVLITVQEVNKAGRATSEANKNRDIIGSVLCPGLGIGIGQIPTWSCARQMFEAYKAIWLDDPLAPNDCSDIWYNNQQLLGWPPTELKVDGRDVVAENRE